MKNYRLMVFIGLIVFFSNLAHFYYTLFDCQTIDLNPHTSAYTVSLHKFIDDLDPLDNWERYALLHPWCSGSGTPTDPYIIKNIMITPSDSYGIRIQNSNAIFYIINCYIFDCGDSGISFNNVNFGGILFTVTINNDDSGIELTESSDCVIYHNEIRGNTWQGISMFKCAGIVIVENIIEENKVSKLVEDL